MGQTLAQKIIAAHAGLPGVDPGQFVLPAVDYVTLNDGSFPLSWEAWNAIGTGRVFDPDRIILVADHAVPAKDARAAAIVKQMKDFAKEQGIRHHYGVGQGGIAHIVMAERGLVGPGDLFVGGDSHTCTLGAMGTFALGMGATDLGYAMATGRTWLKVPDSARVRFEGALPAWISGKDLILHFVGLVGTDGCTYLSLEFGGSAVEELSLSQRLTICNMAVECGAKAGMTPADEKLLAYLAQRSPRRFEALQPDLDARYVQEWEIDVRSIMPQVARPASPANVTGVDQVGDVRVDQVYIGSCANTKIDDFRVVAEIVRGRKVHPDVRVIMTPGSQWVLEQASREGLVTALAEAGITVGPPTCGACYGGHMGLLADGETALTTTNRNFPGRMGGKADVYIASPAVAAATAITGRITHPAEVVGAGNAMAWRPSDASRGQGATIPQAPGWADQRAAEAAGVATESGTARADSRPAHTGRVWRFGDDISTDEIAPGRYAGSTDPAEMAAHVLEGADPAFAGKVQPGDVIVAGRNFGMGSSRERAPVGIKAAGVACVIAGSFARIFFRNAINIGLPILECPEAVAGTEEGDQLTVDFAAGRITNQRTGQTWQAAPFPPFLESLIAAGGLVEYARASREA